jgi:hypothetical protein
MCPLVVVVIILQKLILLVGNVVKGFPFPNLKSLPFGLIVFNGIFGFKDNITTHQQHVLFLLFDELLS